MTETHSPKKLQNQIPYFSSHCHETYSIQCKKLHHTSLKLSLIVYPKKTPREQVSPKDNVIDPPSLLPLCHAKAKVQGVSRILLQKERPDNTAPCSSSSGYALPVLAQHLDDRRTLLGTSSPAATGRLLILPPLLSRAHQQ